MKAFWDERYDRPEYIYGKQPNAFFAEQLRQLRPEGKLLLPAEGEGRNAVFAAEQGLEVTAFDQSERAAEKARLLARERGVRIDYRVGDFTDMHFGAGGFDVIGLVYAHFPASVKEDYNRRLTSLLRPGGWVIFEAFGSAHLEYRAKNPAVGGPGDARMLFSVAELERTFPDFEAIVLREEVATLSEGSHHLGTGSVVRFLGRKIK